MFVLDYFDIIVVYEKNVISVKKMFFFILILIMIIFNWVFVQYRTWTADIFSGLHKLWSLDISVFFCPGDISMKSRGGRWIFFRTVSRTVPVEQNRFSINNNRQFLRIKKRTDIFSGLADIRNLCLFYYCRCRTGM